MSQAILRLRTTITATWQASKQVRVQIWIPFIIILSLNTIAKYLVQFIYNALTIHTVNLNNQIPLHLLIATQLLCAIIIAPIYTGIIVNCIESNSTLKKITFVHLSCFKHTVQLSFISTIIVLLASSANVITYLYFLHAGTHYILLTIFCTLLYPLPWYGLTLLTLPLIYQKNISPLTCLKISFKIMRKHYNWLKVTSIYLSILLLIISTLVPFAYGLLNKNIYIMGISAVLGIIITYRAIPFIFALNATVFNMLTKPPIHR